jgi:hypothetical protein
VSVQQDLTDTIAAACGGGSVVFIGHEQRWKDVDQWFHEALARHFDVFEVRIFPFSACVVLCPFFPFRSPITTFH